MARARCATLRAPRAFAATDPWLVAACVPVRQTTTALVMTIVETVS